MDVVVPREHAERVARAHLTRAAALGSRPSVVPESSCLNMARPDARARKMSE